MDPVRSRVQPIGVDAVLDQERAHLGLSGSESDAPAALCLSGGGIRSATFCLGILQGLAQRLELSKFHYLSTVSGGGYIGSWLSRWIHEESGNVAKVEGILGGTTASAASPEPGQVRNLRAYSNFLSPVWGLSTDFFSLISIFLRNLLLNWSVLVPLLAALVLLPRLYLGVAEFPEVASWLSTTVIVVAAILVVVGIAYVVADMPGELAPGKKTPVDRFALLCFAPIVAAALLLGLATTWSDTILSEASWIRYVIAGAAVHLVGCVAGITWRKVLGIDTGTRSGEKPQPVVLVKAVADFLFVIVSGALGGALIYALARWLPGHVPAFREAKVHVVATFPCLLLCFWLATTAYVAPARFFTSEGDREWWARSGGWWLRACLAWFLAFAIVIYLPPWVLGATGLERSSLAAGGGIWGVVIGAIGYWTKNGAKVVDHAQGFATKVGMGLLDIAATAFIVALLVVLCFLADFGIEKFGPHTAEPAAAPAMQKKTSWKQVEDAAQVTEAAARNVEAVARIPGLGSSTASGASAPVRKAAEAAAEGAKVLETFAPAMQGSLAETTKAAQAAARSSEAVSKSAQAARAADPSAGETMSGALASASSAATTLIGTLSKRVRESQDDAGAGYSKRMVESGLIAPALLAVALLLVGLAMSVFVGVNTFSLHSMYGNRLVRAYFGAARDRASRRPHWFTGFDFNDNVAMKELSYSPVPTGGNRLFHIVNVALNLVAPNGDRLEWQQRKAASFTISPLHSGSALVGYLDSGGYSGREGISLGRAMTISGAAASPNMGYHSSAVVAFVMTFFNVRLGWWLPNSGEAGRSAWPRSEPVWSLPPLRWEALGQTTSDRPYLYLSDGGHFENLGLYEMVRRRCRRIVVVDASEDAGRGYGDLQDALRKIRVDLGISIEFPERAFEAPRRCLVARIPYGTVYKGASDGWLYYLKPTLLGDEPLDVRRYAEESRKNDPANPFPHQSTADQFFDEAQFESYRMLGLHTIEKVLGSGTSANWPAYEAFAASVLNAPPFVPGGGTGSGSATPGGTPGAGDKKGFGGDALGGLTGAVESMGKGALLATAITVGGVVGVTGTVALRDSTVSLKPGSEIAISEKSLEELRNTPLRVEPLALDGATRDELAKTLDTLGKLLQAQNAQNVDVRQSLQITNSIQESLKNWPPAGRNPVPDKVLADSIGKLADAIKALTPELAKSESGLSSQLKKIQETLGTINGSIGSLPPRRTVRGVEGGADDPSCGMPRSFAAARLRDAPEHATAIGMVFPADRKRDDGERQGGAIESQCARRPC